ARPRRAGAGGAGRGAGRTERLGAGGRGPRGGGRQGPAEAAFSAPPGRAAESRRAPAPPMMGIVSRLFAREPVLSAAGPRDARALAALHGVSFHRGWSDDEFERLLFDRNVIAHRAMVGRSLIGFIVSRLVLDEAETLSIAVASARRGKGLARQLLDINLRRRVGVRGRSVCLEVDEGNVPALRLYRSAGFRDVGRRQAYYPAGRGSAALILRRDLV